MNKEEKELLTKDFCARLSYGLKLNFYSRATNENVLCTLLGVEPESEKPIIAKTDKGAFTFTQDHVKPYLRPMSSMTEEEMQEYQMFIEYSYNDFTSESTPCVYVSEINKYIDWLNAHHFDYQGLIEMRLALEAPEGMYNC